jgi:predicted nuclease with RNAse H fold
VSTVYLGIDLAAQPAGTAACRLAFGDAGAVVEDLRAGLDDDELTALRDGARIVAIDAPFGWPRAFTTSLATWAVRAEWLGAEPQALRYRATDLEVQASTGLWPLSASSDRIGVCAWRCAGLLAGWGVRDLTGADSVAEVYPAAALRRWGLPARGYKAAAPDARARTRAARAELVAELRRGCPWLTLSGGHAEDCVATHDLLDAVVCALMARAIDIGETTPPPPDLADLAREEGWIHLPAGDLSELF